MGREQRGLLVAALACCFGTGQRRCAVDIHLRFGAGLAVDAAAALGLDLLAPLRADRGVDHRLRHIVGEQIVDGHFGIDFPVVFDGAENMALHSGLL